MTQKENKMKLKNVRNMPIQSRYNYIYGIYKYMIDKYPKIKIDYLMQEIADQTGYKSISRVYQIVAKMKVVKK